MALHANMRTTVTLDADVERLLKDAVRKTGKSFESRACSRRSSWAKRRSTACR
jgi:hypothetical protein